jgi:glycosyltransferase involved in cell wall biosynthesis
VKVIRVQKRRMNEKGRISYLSKLLKFLLISAVVITRHHLEKPYQLIHVHSVPDFEVFAAAIPKLRGARLILDIHDIVPEFYAAKFKVGKNSLLYKALVLVEKASGAFSDHVIISNHIWEKTLLARSASVEKCTTIMNYPDEAVFFRRSELGGNRGVVMIYPGSLNWHQGLDIAIRAFARVSDKVPEAKFVIYGEGGEFENLKRLIGQLGIGDKVLLRDTLPIGEIAEIMARCDIGIVPKRNDSFGGEAFSTKILEFMALGVPVIVSATKIDRYYFNDSVVKFFEPENEEDLAEKMLTLIKDPSQRKHIASNADKFFQDYTWENKKHVYLDLVDRLVTGR